MKDIAMILKILPWLLTAGLPFFAYYIAGSVTAKALDAAWPDKERPFPTRQ